MGRLLTGALALAVTVGALVLAYAVGAPLATVLGAAAGALALLWLLVLLTVPWDLYFRAHSLLSEIAVSREKGLVISKERDTEARRIARVMLRVAVGGHLLSAVLAVVVALVTGAAAGYWIAGFFLLSTVFRPAGAWFKQTGGRLGTLLRDVRYPRDDVVLLRHKVDDVVRGATVLEAKAEEQYAALAKVRRTLDALNVTVYQRADEADRRIAALGREFQATVDRLASNEEIIAGLKAFVRLVRNEGTRTT
ncbi:hypothetical protein AB0M28_13950 [Streptomyces sp. NPDC051940]|uniref:hypothetical protein n=1 Tax=Streptomyces sp. NPDC051940 TaxID=3155675 RepID=UPI003438DE99